MKRQSSTLLAKLIIQGWKSRSRPTTVEFEDSNIFSIETLHECQQMMSEIGRCVSEIDDFPEYEGVSIPAGNSFKTSFDMNPEIIQRPGPTQATHDPEKSFKQNGTPEESINDHAKGTLDFVMPELYWARQCLRKVLVTIATNTKHICQADDVSMVMSRHDGIMLNLYKVDTETGEVSEHALALGKSLIRSTANSGEVKLINEVQSHPDFNPGVDRLGRSKVNSMMCIPMIQHATSSSPDKVIGVIVLYKIGVSTSSVALAPKKRAPGSTFTAQREEPKPVTERTRIPRRLLLFPDGMKDVGAHLGHVGGHILQVITRRRT